MRWGVSGAALLTGCVTVQQETQSITIHSQPTGVTISAIEEGEGPTPIGSAPGKLDFDYEVRRSDLAAGAMVLGILTIIGGGAGGVTYGILKDNNTALGLGIGSIVVGALIAYVGTANREQILTRKIQLVASREGYLDQTIDLEVPTAKTQRQFNLVKAPHRVETREPVVLAVFDLQDRTGTQQQRQSLQLTEYLASKLAEADWIRLVPRSDLRRALTAIKAESYEGCFDESCQIELGKAVAATKSVAANVLRVGEQCVITASIFDLTSETTETSATVDTACDEAALLGAIREVAARLVR